jgi:TonB-dependent SusC/RagA subfamily outer membrane receptor
MRSTVRVVSRWWRGALLGVLLTAAAVEAGSAQEGRINGRVTDATTGAPMSEVQIYLAGANLGSLSRQNGVYVIVNVPAGTYELRAERIGMAPASRQVTIAAGASVEENFQLTAQALGLDEIVVTGTAGAARRREVGNLVTQINTVDLPDRPVAVTDMLLANGSGIEITGAGGGEVGQGVLIRLRGVNSINSNRPPIIMIDGVRLMEDNFAQTSSPDFRGGRGANNMPSPLNSLNPADIERIEIIKGPAASTLYGTEASNGVIQIFTKRGVARAAVWTAEIQEGTSWMQRFGIEGSSTFRTPVSSTDIFPDDYVPIVTNPKYLWMDPWICTAPFSCGQYQHIPRVQDYSLTVRGGSQDIQYFLSSGFAGELGSMPNERMDRWNVRGNFTINPVEDLIIQWNTSYTNTWQKNTPVGNNAAGLTLNVFRGEEYNNQTYLGLVGIEALNELNTFDVQQEVERTTTGGTLTYSPLTNLTNRITLGYDMSQQETRGLRPFGFALWPQGGLDVQVYTRRYLTFDYVGTFSFDVMPELRSNFSWGGQAVGDQSARVEAWGEGFPGAANPTVSSGSSTLGFESRQAVWNAGFFFQDVLDFRNKYFLTLGLRVDGNSTFGKGFGLAMYPKASASWVMSDESFWRPAFGEMKLRGAYGLSGRAPSALAKQRTWENSGLGGAPAFIPGNLGNPDIGPEVTAEHELGFDAAWFNQRVRANFTYYKQVTSDAIQSVASLPSLGFTQSVSYNIGKVENMGTETGLDVSVIQNRNWGVDLGATLTSNKSNVLEWAGEDPATSSRIGRPISYSTWTMFKNEMGMGTLLRAEGTYQVQDCLIPGPINPTTGLAGDSVPRPGLDPTIHACTQSSTRVYGYPSTQWPRMVNGTATIRMPFGAVLSARGEYRAGRFSSFNPVDLGRNVRSPWCYPYYVSNSGVTLKADTPGTFVHRCTPSLGGGHNRKDDFFKLRSVSLSFPMDFAFPDRVQNSQMTIVLGNAYTWSYSPWGVNGVDGSHKERLPPATTLRASLRVTF